MRDERWKKVKYAAEDADITLQTQGIPGAPPEGGRLPELYDEIEAPDPRPDRPGIRRRQM